MTTQLIPRLLATHAMLLRPDQTAVHASSAELWPMLAIVLDEPGQSQVRELFEALDHGPYGPAGSSLRCVWSSAQLPAPVLRLSIASRSAAGPVHTEVVLPAQTLIDHLDLVATARTAALTTRKRAHQLTPGTSLREALHNIMLIGPAPTAELNRLAQQQAHVEGQLRLAN